LKDTEYSTPPREFIFVLDRSGSMIGEPIAQAKNALSACLRSLNEDDNFRILLFDHELEWFKFEPSKVNQQAIDEADKFISGIEGRGGTGIVSAIKSALSIPDDPARSRYVIFLTDGAVSAEERALQEIRSHIDVARIFTFGIGPSVNRALLQRLAHLGRGASEFLHLNEDIEGAIIRFQDRISFPVLTNVNIKWKNIKAWDIYPSILPDLYIGEPLEITGRLSAGKKPPILIIDGELENKLETFEVKLPTMAESEPAVSRLWAKSRVDSLIESTVSKRETHHKIRAEIISLALEHHLVTPYTAFVAIDKQITSENGPPKKIYVSQPLPEGLDISGFTRGQVMVSAKGPRRMRKLAAPSPHSPRMRRGTSSKGHMASIASDTSPMLYQAAPLREELDEESEIMDQLEPGDNIRWLARKQKINGSWSNDVEKTSTAVLAFLRNGHTDRKGHYRKQISRAIAWLNATDVPGLASFAKAFTLTELSKVTGLKIHQDMALAAVDQLPQPGTEMERAFLEIINGKDRSTNTPNAIKTMDDLRLAVINRISFPVPADLHKSSDEELRRAWIAAKV
jgi:uncharacterized protein YegL